MTFAIEAQSRLHALAARLSDTYDDLDVETVADGLRVRSASVPGCCELVRRRGDTITCRIRRDDGLLWFFTSWRETIATADHVAKAASVIHRYVSGRP